MKDIMLDLETIDITPTAAIVAIGAVHCNLTTGEQADTFYRVVDFDGQLELGMSIRAKTMYWWMEQSEAARQAICQEQKSSLRDACGNFKQWLLSIDESGERLRLWGNGASFDNAIIRYAFSRFDAEFPVKYWNDRDMRTVVGFYPKKLQEDWRNNNRRRGAHHNALADAKHQVKYCSDILKELGVTELY